MTGMGGTWWSGAGDDARRSYRGGPWVLWAVDGAMLVGALGYLAGAGAAGLVVGLLGGGAAWNLYQRPDWLDALRTHRIANLALAGRAEKGANSDGATAETSVECFGGPETSDGGRLNEMEHFLE
jgi:hypothetical protein